MPEHHAKYGKKPNVLAAIGVAGILVLLVLTLYLGSKLESLEDQLAYQPPVANTTATGTTTGLATASVYVPVYSHIYSNGGIPVLLESTLSVRNTDPDNAITVTSVRFYDTKGKLIKDYLNGQVKLAPLESAEILVEKRDNRGGSGANFIVTWKADNSVYKPLIEAVMVGRSDNQSVSFLSRGIHLVNRTAP